jgi:hypothetical protein
VDVYIHYLIRLHGAQRQVYFLCLIFPTVSSCKAGGDRVRFATAVTRSIIWGRFAHLTAHLHATQLNIARRSQFMNFHIPMGSLVLNTHNGRDAVRCAASGHPPSLLFFIRSLHTVLKLECIIGRLDLTARTCHIWNLLKKFQ